MQKNLQQSPFAAIQPGFAGLRPESKRIRRRKHITFYRFATL